MRMLERFVRDICQCEALWTPAKIIDDAGAFAKVGDDVRSSVSGGVDSFRHRDAAAPRQSKI